MRRVLIYDSKYRKYTLINSHDIIRKARQRANIIQRCFVPREVSLLVRAFIKGLLEYNCGLVSQVAAEKLTQRTFETLKFGSVGSAQI